MLVRDVRWKTKYEFTLPAWSNFKIWFEGYVNLWSTDGHKFPAKIKTETLTLHSIVDLENLVHRSENEGIDRWIIQIPWDAREGNRSLWSIVAARLNLEFRDLYPHVDLADQTNESQALCLVLDKSFDFKNDQLTILIPHWESIGFLTLCLWSINNLFSAGDRPKVLIIDDGSSAAAWNEVQNLAAKYEMQAVQVLREDARTVADVGMLLDKGLAFIGSPYVCMLDADTVLTDKNIFKDGVRKLEQKFLISYGLDTGLAESYHENKYWKKTGSIYGIQLPQFQSATNNLFRIMRTADAIAVSRAVGFSRRVFDRKWRDQLGRVIRKVDNSLLKNTRYHGKSRSALQWKILNSKYPAMPPTGDNGVSANHWMDANEMGFKFNTPIISYGLKTPSDGVVFQNISNQLVHVALSTRALSASRREIDNAGAEYYEAVRAIVDLAQPEDILYERAIRLSRTHQF